MIRVIIENLATIIISAILICLGVLAVIKIYKDKKKGSCSCGCSGCPQSQNCHKD
ncbi:FeoB-associated Cys-rich membrane protein [Acetivibrio mesophilus]|uniref:FeoB-associated Cys-rich membrane protein n=1 Tax=Acetivibrio mesophilus TaxID=2487273 RepID=A0A4Q0I6X6_9FIRM|nr:FeoB-associated Cys-rich membrane protein [Acetivibrio mesophilus]RXE60153.1 FeoB-associated Cys-rich membrane protein [Acetivibrio mesophilus]HHV29089.1 FeoB-associated Cys-rich membrane protein [Clostridium sp.]